MAYVSQKSSFFAFFTCARFGWRYRSSAFTKIINGLVYDFSLFLSRIWVNPIKLTIMLARQLVSWFSYFLILGSQKKLDAINKDTYMLLDKKRSCGFQCRGGYLFPIWRRHHHRYSSFWASEHATIPTFFIYLWFRLPAVYSSNCNIFPSRTPCFWTKVICCQHERKMYFYRILPEW